MLPAAAGNHAAFAGTFQPQDVGIHLHDPGPPRHQPVLRSNFQASTNLPQVAAQSHYAPLPGAGDIVAQGWHALSRVPTVRLNSSCVVDWQSAGPAHVVSHPWHSAPQFPLQQLHQWQHTQLQPHHCEQAGIRMDGIQYLPHLADEPLFGSAHGDDSTGSDVWSGQDCVLGQHWALNCMINLSNPSRAGAGAAAYGARPTGSGFMCLPFGGAPGPTAPAASGLAKFGICPTDPGAAPPRDLKPVEPLAACSQPQAHGAGEPDAGSAHVGADITSFGHAVVHHADHASPAQHLQVQQQRQYGRQQLEQLGHTETSSELGMLNPQPSLPADLQYQVVQHSGIPDGENFNRKPEERVQLQVHSGAADVTQPPQLRQLQQKQSWGPYNVHKGSWNYSANGANQNTLTTAPLPNFMAGTSAFVTGVSHTENNYIPKAFDPILPVPCDTQPGLPSPLPPLPATRDGASISQPTSRLADVAASGAASPFIMDPLYGFGSPAALDLSAAVNSSPFMLSPFLRHQQDDTGCLAGWLASPPSSSNRICMRDEGGAADGCAIVGPCATQSTGGLIVAMASPIKLSGTATAAGVLDGVNPPCSERDYALLLRRDGVKADEEGTTTAAAPTGITQAGEVEEGAAATLPHFGSCLMTTHEEEFAGLSSPSAMHMQGCPWAGLGLGSPAGSLEHPQMQPFLSSPPPPLNPNQDCAGINTGNGGATIDSPGTAGLTRVAGFCTDKAAAPDAVLTQTGPRLDPSAADPAPAADIKEATEDQTQSPQRRVSQRIRKSTTRSRQDTSYLYASVPGDLSRGVGLGRGGGLRGTRRQVARRAVPAKGQKDGQSNDQKEIKDILLPSHVNTDIKQEQEELTGPQLAPQDRADGSHGLTIAKPEVHLAQEVATADAITEIVEGTAAYVKIASVEAVGTGAKEAAAQVPRGGSDPPAATPRGSNVSTASFKDSEIDYTCPLDRGPNSCHLGTSRAEGNSVVSGGANNGALENALIIAPAGVAASNTAATAADIRTTVPTDADQAEDRQAAVAPVHTALEATPTIAALWPVAESTVAAVIAPTRRYGHRARARKLQLELKVANMADGQHDVQEPTATVPEGHQGDKVLQPTPLPQPPLPEKKVRNGLEIDTAAPGRCGLLNPEADGFEGLCVVTQQPSARRMQRSGSRKATSSGVSMLASGGRGAGVPPVANGAGVHVSGETLVDISPTRATASVETGADLHLAGGRSSMFAADVCAHADGTAEVVSRGGSGSSSPKGLMALQEAMTPVVVGRRSAQRRYVRWSNADSRCVDSVVLQKDALPNLPPLGTPRCQELELARKQVLVEPPIVAPMGSLPPSVAQRDPEQLSPGTSRPGVDVVQEETVAVERPQPLQPPQPVFGTDTADNSKAYPVPRVATEPAALPEVTEATEQRSRRTASRGKTHAPLPPSGHGQYSISGPHVMGTTVELDGLVATSAPVPRRRRIQAGAPPAKAPGRDTDGNKDLPRDEQQVDLQKQPLPLLELPQSRRQFQTKAQLPLPLLLPQPHPSLPPPSPPPLPPAPQPQSQRQSILQAQPQPRPHSKLRLPHKKRLYEWDLEQELSREALESRPTTVRAPGPSGALHCGGAMRPPRSSAPLPPIAPQREEPSKVTDASGRTSRIIGKHRGCQRIANAGCGPAFGTTEGADGQRPSQDAAGFKPLRRRPLQQCPPILAAFDGNLGRNTARGAGQPVESIPRGELPDKDPVVQGKASADDIYTTVNRSDGGVVICRQAEPSQTALTQCDDGVVCLDAEKNKPKNGSWPGAVMPFTEAVSLPPMGSRPDAAVSIVSKQESARSDREKGANGRRSRVEGSDIAGVARKVELTNDDLVFSTTKELGGIGALGAGMLIVPQRAAALRAVAAITATNGAAGASTGGAGSRGANGLGNSIADQGDHARRRPHGTDRDLSAAAGKEDKHRCKRRKTGQSTITLAPVTRRAAAAAAAAAALKVTAALACDQHGKRLHRGNSTAAGPPVSETSAGLAAADLSNGEAPVQNHAVDRGTGDLQLTGDSARVDGASDEDMPGSLAMADAAATLRLLGRKRGAVGPTSGTGKDEQQQGSARAFKRTRRQQGDAQPWRLPATDADAKLRLRTARSGNDPVRCRGQRREVRGHGCGQGSGLQRPTRASSREVTRAEAKDEAAATGVGKEVAADRSAIGVKQDVAAATDDNLGASDIQEVAAGSRAAAAVAAAAAAAAAAVRVTGGTSSTPQSRGFAAKKRGKRPPGQIPNVLAAAASILLSMQPGVMVYEKSFRQELGNNPDTSKALRLLREQGYVERTGGGFRCDPYGYTVTTAGLKAAEEQRRREREAEQEQGQS